MKPVYVARHSGLWFNTIKPDFNQKTMILFGAISGRLLGRFTAGITVTVKRVVLSSRQVALNERQFVDSIRVEAVSQL